MRRRWLVVIGVVVLVLAAGAVVANYALRATAEDRIAGPLRSALGADPSAQVKISQERPFLLQLASGHLDHVTVTADRLTLNGTEVSNVRADATDVSVTHPYVAQHVTVTGTVPTAAIQQRLASKGLKVDIAVSGENLRASGTVLRLPWGVTMTPVAGGDKLTVDPVSADVAGVQVSASALPQPIKDVLSGIEVPVTGLPQGVSLTGARVVPGGVEVTLTGEDVALAH